MKFHWLFVCPINAFSSLVWRSYQELYLWHKSKLFILWNWLENCWDTQWYEYIFLNTQN